MKNSSSENNPQEVRPVFIYDGDCAFCSRWVERWKTLTRGKVDFETSQSAAPRFPEISAGEFRKSVYLVQPERTSRGAEAVFRMLAYNRCRRWMLWMYQAVPGARAVCDAFYAVVAANRGFFSILTKFFWGRDLRPPTYFISQDVFRKSLAIIYAIAFVSLLVQIPGLYGPSGIAPIGEFLEAVVKMTGTSPVRYWFAPSLAWLNSGTLFLQLLCAAGMAFSLLAFSGKAARFSLFMLWLIYMSFSSVGQDFLSFQWDALLLEAGFLAIFWARPAVPFARTLLVLLLFKLMFSSGMVKIVSRDAVWRDLTALTYHYWSQPLPGPLSWFMHQLPLWFQKASAAAMFFIELIAPFLLFFPRNVRKAGVFMLLFLQAVIFLTGNYSFFNLLAAALCLAAVDDAMWPKRTPRVPDDKKPFILVKAAALLAAVTFLTVSSVQVSWLLGIKLPWYRQAVVISNALMPFNSLNAYGLFAVMTKTRREIFIEGSYDGKQWFAYDFKYKPGDVERFPGPAAPHQPRLDWQMWFAALGKAEQNPWFLQLCKQLLKGEPAVLGLLKTNPFPGKPPQYIRAVTYQYRFTDFEEFRKTGAWWKRQYEGVYLPPVSADIKS